LVGAAPHTPTFAVPRDRLRPGARSKLAALLAMIVLWTTPATGDDLIEKWLRQDESSGQVDVVRQDLNAFTNEEWKDIFDIGSKQPDAELGRLLLERAAATPTHVFSAWLAALAAAFAMMIRGTKARTYLRREFKTLTAPLYMKDPS
jgi:hypothetical protein